MSKAILVMDMPESCIDCPLRDWEDNCKGQSEDKNNNAGTWEELRKTCPLREVPQKKKVCGKYPQADKIPPSYKIGYNTAIDEILGKDV